MARSSSTISDREPEVQRSEAGGPRVRVEFDPPAAPISVGKWRCRWRIRNIGSPLLAVTTAWLPHGQFRAERQAFDPPIRIPGGDSGRLSVDVECKEEAGIEVENAFVILTADVDGEDWRVFARLTVSFGKGGVPGPRTVLVTSSRVGFTEVAAWRPPT